MPKHEEKWRSVDVIERDGDLMVLQQRVYAIYERDGDAVSTEPGRRHRLKRLRRALRVGSTASSRGLSRLERVV